jgi:hypothetical protein
MMCPNPDPLRRVGSSPRRGAGKCGRELCAIPLRSVRRFRFSFLPASAYLVVRPSLSRALDTAVYSATSAGSSLAISTYTRVVGSGHSRLSTTVINMDSLYKAEQ